MRLAGGVTCRCRPSVISPFIGSLWRLQFLIGHHHWLVFDVARDLKFYLAPFSAAKK
jgi:hypothetical protein